jgi:hypothetical protein
MPGRIELIPLLLGIEMFLAVLHYIHINMPAAKEVVGIRKSFVDNCD